MTIHSGDDRFIVKYNGVRIRSDMFPNAQAIGIERPPYITDQCHNCGAKIRTMCFKGTDWCSEECRAQLEEENA